MQREFFPSVAGCTLVLSHDEVYDLIVAPHEARFDATAARELVAARCALERSNMVPVVSSELLVGSPFCGARDSFVIARRLKCLWPHAKVLVVLRQQVDAMLSLYKQYVLTGGVCSAHEFFLPPRSFSWNWFSDDYYQYDRLVEYYQSLFGVDAVVVRLYEDFAASTADFATHILVGLGLPVDDTDARPNRRVHASLSLGATRILRIANRLERTPNNPAPLVHLPGLRVVSQKGLRKIDPLLRRFVSDRRLRDWLNQRYEGVFTAGNRRLESILGRDLRALGYV
jgi:hypothetical protein